MKSVCAVVVAVGKMLMEDGVFSFSAIARSKAVLQLRGGAHKMIGRVVILVAGCQDKREEDEEEDEERELR